jgi:preprotein translocase subunit SecD
MKTKIVIGSILFVILALIVWARILTQSQHMLSAPPGHGVDFIIEADLSQMQGQAEPLQLLKKSLAKRLAFLGVGAYMKTISASQLRIALPITRSNDVEYARNLITRSGLMEMRLVNERSDAMVQNGNPIPPGWEVLTNISLGNDGVSRMETLVVNQRAEPGLAGNILKSVKVGRGFDGGPEIDFVLNPASVTAFAEVTRKNIGRRLAIVIDGKLYEAPVINSPIETGTGEITGNLGLGDMTALVDALENSLPCPTKIIYEEIVY